MTSFHLLNLVYCITILKQKKIFERNTMQITVVMWCILKILEDYNFTLVKYPHCRIL